MRQEIKDSDEIPFVETTGQPIKRSFLEMKSCVPIKETDPNVHSDNKEADIFGCCWLPDGNGLIVCDHENKALKLFDKDMHVKFTAICSSNPYDVCCIDKTTAVVTLHNTKEIQFVTVYPGLKFIETCMLWCRCIWKEYLRLCERAIVYDGSKSFNAQWR